MSKKWFSTNAFKSAPEGVDTEKGIIFGVAVVTAGEAKGHGVSLDTSFVESAVEQGNAKKSGIKARFGHPNMCSTALGSFIGRVKNFRADGDIARGDLFLSNESKETPNGNLHGYVIGMAKNEPDMFGLSIVFTPGDSYKVNDGEVVKQGDEGFADAGGDTFIELGKLHAADVVDDPAANPDGLFSAWSQETFAGQATEFFDTHPEVFELMKANPEVVQEFMSRYSAESETHIVDSVESLSSLKKENEMEEKKEVEVIKDEGNPELERFNALAEEFPENPTFVAEQFKSGASVTEAKVAHAEVLKVELSTAKTRILELEASVTESKKESASDESEGGDAVDAGKEKVGKDFDSLVQEQMALGKSPAEAIKFCVSASPESYAKAKENK